jgi:uncharacterized cofD-like protein
MIKLVTIGGGTGSYTVLSGLKEIQGINIRAIVSMSDDGGSTGVLRDELGVLPSGDVRQCLVALSSERDVMRSIMNYRFEDGGLKGHSFGNILLATLEKVTGSFALGVKEASKILNINGEVIPVVNESATLCIELNNGELIRGENEINNSDFEKIGVDKLYICEKLKINEEAKLAIEEADYILIGPGNQYCSILPALVVDGVSEALRNTQGKVIYISSLTNKKGHTINYKLSNYVNEIEKYIKRKLDIILVNSELPTGEQITQYKLVEGDGVMVSNDMRDDNRILEENLLSHKINIQQKGDAISSLRSFIRHDSLKLRIVLEKLIMQS